MRGYGVWERGGVGGVGGKAFLLGGSGAHLIKKNPGCHTVGFWGFLYLCFVLGL